MALKDETFIKAGRRKAELEKGGGFMPASVPPTSAYKADVAKRPLLERLKSFVSGGSKAPEYQQVRDRLEVEKSEGVTRGPGDPKKDVSN